MSYNPKILLRRVVSVLATLPRLRDRWFPDVELLFYVQLDNKFSTTTVRQLNHVIHKDRFFIGNRIQVMDNEGDILFYLWQNLNKCDIEDGKERHVNFYCTKKDDTSVSIPCN